MDQRSFYAKNNESPLARRHNNPVAAGLSHYRKAYTYSSAKYYVTGEDGFGIITHWMD